MIIFSYTEKKIYAGNICMAWAILNLVMPFINMVTTPAVYGVLEYLVMPTILTVGILFLMFAILDILQQISSIRADGGVIEA